MENDKPLEELIVLTFEIMDDLPVSWDNVENMPIPEDEKAATLEQLTTAFKKAGWDGDGGIGYCWLPPFLYNAVSEDGPGTVFGVTIYIVKQYNNGTTFIALEPEGLSYISKTSLLARQNPDIFGLKE